MLNIFLICSLQDNNTTLSLKTGLIDSSKISDMKIMGAILNPLFQSELRMTAAGMCTEEQYKAGEIELLDRLERFHERQLEIDSDSDLEDPEQNCKWDTMVYNSNRQDEESPIEKAEKEFKKYLRFKQGVYQPKMEPKKVLGAIDKDGQPKEPVYGLGPVLAGGRGKDLPSKRNLADYVTGNGDFDIVKYLVDHAQLFPGLFSVGVGELCPHLSTEVDCESLFSQAGFKSHPRRTQTDIRNYERLVVTKHRMQNMYIPPKKVQDLFMERWKKNDWTENEERDDKEFLDIEKSIYLEFFPNVIDDDKSEGEAGDKEMSKASKEKETVEIDKESESDNSSECDSNSGTDTDSDSDSDKGDNSDDDSEDGSDST